jgi:hypothetical protein
LSPASPRSFSEPTHEPVSRACRCRRVRVRRGTHRLHRRPQPSLSDHHHDRGDVIDDDQRAALHYHATAIVYILAADYLTFDGTLDLYDYVGDVLDSIFTDDLSH